MSSRLDPAVQALRASTAQTAFTVPDPPPSAAELALALRARDSAAPRVSLPPFDGKITNTTVPVRWGTVPTRTLPDG